VELAGPSVLLLPLRVLLLLKDTDLLISRKNNFLTALLQELPIDPIVMEEN
jgi:hypothetical protein